MDKDTSNFRHQIVSGIPDVFPSKRLYDVSISHAPKRKDILSVKEKKQAIKNALRYFPSSFHNTLAPEFYHELIQFGRIYMYRFRPLYSMFARPIEDYTSCTLQAASMMMMIQNNLNPDIAQYPHELITYGGNGAVFQNWAQYLLTMKYLATMTNQQTLHIYSGHPMGLFPSCKEAPRAVITNGMMIPNYSKPDDWEKFNALGVTQYGQMTAGSYMYIGPQGIVHGTHITLLNVWRKISQHGESIKGKLFLSSGLGGMSGAQPKAGSIAKCITVIAEINPQAILKRYRQGWVDEVIDNLNQLVIRVKKAKEKKEIISIAYQGNIVDVWETFDHENIYVDMGSDQTSLHNPWAGGYYPMGLSYEDSNALMVKEPTQFAIKVKNTLCRHVSSINKHVAKGTYFFDYGNAFLLEASRAGADIMNDDGLHFKYPSYVQDIIGPLYFDYGFGPFRWICTSGKEEDLNKTDIIAENVLRNKLKTAPEEIRCQVEDNIEWIVSAQQNNLVVGSKARILYTDAEGRIALAEAFNQAIQRRDIGPVILGRDHHDVSGTDSPFRETSNIEDGSKFTSDMAIQNVIGDSFRGATWVSIHNGGGVGWGEVINGGFGLLLEGTLQSINRAYSMLYYDVNNGIARRAWAGNKGAISTITRAQKKSPQLVVTMPHAVDSKKINTLL